MNRNSQNPKDTPHAPARKGVIIGIFIAALVAVGAAIAFRKGGSPPAPPTETAPPAPPQPKLFVAKPRLSGDPNELPAPGPAPVEPANPNATLPPTRAAVTNLGPPSSKLPPPTPQTQALVTRLSQLDVRNGAVTPEQAAAFKESLAELKQRGAESVPAIKEFLDKNLDLAFGGLAGGKDLGASSLRASLIDALGGIGGADASGALMNVLQSTSVPGEIAQIARVLEQQAPGMASEAATAAAREALALAASGKLGNQDVGPLFGVLTTYGGAGAVGDLERATERWKYYSPIALAQMPDGAGVPSLIQMVQDSKGVSGRAGALQALAQVATTSPEAQTALLQQAQQGRIPFATMMTIADILAGHQMYIGTIPEGANAANTKSWHLTYGNQNFYSLPNTANWTPEMAQQNLQVIDGLLAANKDPGVTELLQRARNTVSGVIKPPAP